MTQLDTAIAKARDRLLSIQNEKGYWVFSLEADVTIPSEYVLLQRFMGREMASGLQRRLARYLRRRQLKDGGWPLYEGGAANLSASVKAYFALKLMGDSPGEPHMVRARHLILSMGGAAKSNVFTRITLALFGQIPWQTTPAMPVEIMLLPRWFFFHLQKVSSWSRTVIVPLLILYARRPVCNLNPEQSIVELFKEPPGTLRHLDHFTPGNFLKNVFILLDRILKRIDPLIPGSFREKAIHFAEQWTIDHMQGEGGIGGIFPAMANAVMALKILGYPEDNPDLTRGLKALDDLLIIHEDEAFCQPCNSPIWDTCLSLTALLEAGLPAEHPAVTAGINWLFKQAIQVPGDWVLNKPNLEPCAWAFQFENDFYPDLDDTASVIMALLRAGIPNKNGYREKMIRAVSWVMGMQSADGGWGAFDVDNNYLYLNHIPFADHGALLDPSTSDVTARCIELLSVTGFAKDCAPVEPAIKFLRREQEACGGWFGRWGVNYIYGTWSVLTALKQAGEDMSLPYIRNAVDWLKSCQNSDNGWGETCDIYDNPTLAGQGPSTPSQTAWALLALMAAGEVHSIEVKHGINYLYKTQADRGGWDEKNYTGTGFPGVFYLRYHGYSQYFPLWALGSYRRLLTGRQTCQEGTRLKSTAVLGLVVALPLEARWLLGWRQWQRIDGRRFRQIRLSDKTNLICICSGVGLKNAFEAAMELIGRGATALAVVGMSGGLDPALKAGDLVIADKIFEDRENGSTEWNADSKSIEFARLSLKAEGIPVQCGPLFTSRQSFLTTGSKKSLHRASRTLAVDMESAAVARAAVQRNLPFFVLRSICDPSSHSISKDFFDCLDPNGKILLPMLLKRLLRKPHLFVELLHMIKMFAGAMRALKQAWRMQLKHKLPGFLASSRR